MDITLLPFSNAFRDIQRAISAFEQPLTSSAGRSAPQIFRYPPTDILETPEGYELHADLPGYDKKKVKIELAEDRRTLILSGNLEEEAGDKDNEGKSSGTTPSTADSNKKEEGGVKKEQQESAAASLKEAAKATAEKLTGGTPAQEKAENKSKEADQDAAEKKTTGSTQEEKKQGDDKSKEQQQATTKGDQRFAKRQQEQQQKTPQWWVNERLHASFTRSYTFPTPIKAEGIKARFEDGVLKIFAPKDVDSHPKQINID